MANIIIFNISIYNNDEDIILLNEILSNIY
jgi:hypothetical protein